MSKQDDDLRQAELIRSLKAACNPPKPPAVDVSCTISEAEDYLEQLWRLVDGDLAEAEEDRLRGHVDGCPYCTANVARMAAANAGAERQEIVRSAEVVWARITPASGPERTEQGVRPLAEIRRLVIAIKEGAIEVLSNPGRLVPQPAVVTRGEVPAPINPLTTVELSSMGVICRVQLSGGERNTFTAAVCFDLMPDHRKENTSVRLIGAEGLEVESLPLRDEGVTFASLPPGVYSIELCCGERTVTSFCLEVVG